VIIFRRSDYLVKAHFRPGICLRCFASHSASHGCFGDGCCHFGRHEASFHGCSVDVYFHFGKAHSATDTHFAAADGDARFANRFAYHFAVYSVQHGLFVVAAAAAVVVVAQALHLAGVPCQHPTPDCCRSGDYYLLQWQFLGEDASHHFGSLVGHQVVPCPSADEESVLFVVEQASHLPSTGPAAAALAKEHFALLAAKEDYFEIHGRDYRSCHSPHPEVEWMHSLNVRWRSLPYSANSHKGQRKRKLENRCVYRPRSTVGVFLEARVAEEDDKVRALEVNR
jgi:hypothetical protein